MLQDTPRRPVSALAFGAGEHLAQGAKRGDI